MAPSKRIRNWIFTLAALPAALVAQQAAAPPADGDAAAAAYELPDLTALGPDLANALSTSHVGLVEEELPEGGYRLDLQGRFRQVVFARVGADGQAAVSHALPLELLLEPTGAAASCRESGEEFRNVSGDGDARR